MLFFLFGLRDFNSGWSSCFLFLLVKIILLEWGGGDGGESKSFKKLLKLCFLFLVLILKKIFVF